MNTWEFNTVEKMLLALLRSSLHQQEAETAFFLDVSLEEWKQCYQLAAQHGVMALAWEGVMTLPDALRPLKALKVNWGLAVEAYERKYRRYCRTADELSRFYAQHGIAMVQLKGVGYSHLYPIPSHREGGDIDIYTYAAEGSGMTDAEANALADRLVIETGMAIEKEHSIKHSTFVFQGITIENHKTFLDVKLYDVAPQVEKILKRIMNPQTISLVEGQVLVPSVAFNTLFIAFHALGHFPGLMTLHHLYDWAVLIQRYGVQLPEELKDDSLLDGIAALTHLCNELLGTSVEVQRGKETACMIKENMFRPKYLNDVPVTGRINILIYKMKRMLHAYYLKSSILHYPLWKRICGSIMLHVKHPEIVFRNELH